MQRIIKPATKYLFPGMVLGGCLSVFSVLALAAGELHHGGRVNVQSQLPQKAIDTDAVPGMILERAAKPDDPLPVYKLAKNTYFLFGNIAQLDDKNRGFNGNAGFVVTSGGVVVIDALGSPLLGKRLIATVRTVTDQPIKYLIITHNHPDHAYGAIAFRDAPSVRIIMHEGVKRYVNSEDFANSVNYRKDLLAPDMRGFAMPAADELIGGDVYSKHTISVGGTTFDIYNVGKHHSYGDLVVHQVEDGIVWISDLAFNQRVTFMGDGHSHQAIEAQTWLLKNFTSAKLMVPGHGSAQTPPFPMVEKTKAYISQLRSKMADMVENGVSLDDAVDQAEMPEWKTIRLYDLNHRANANFIYREMEQEYFK